MTNYEHVARPNETLWDQANRILLEALVPVANACLNMSSSAERKESDHLLYMYTSSFENNKQALKFLLKAREQIHAAYEWTEVSPEKWTAQLVTLHDDVLSGPTFKASFAFTEFVKSWQPLMDAIAGIVQLALATSGTVRIRRETSMVRLAKVAESANWPQKASAIQGILAQEINWYLSEIRIMRNQLVHNKRVAFLLPRPESPRTTVEIKKPGHEETLDRFDLDRFLSWVYGKHLIFCANLADVLWGQT